MISWLGAVQGGTVLDVPALRIEVIEERLPLHDDHSFRNAMEGDVLPLLSMLLSRERYWMQDDHLDVVVQLGGTIGAAAIQGEFTDAAGAVLSSFSIDPLPAASFIFYPPIPDALLSGGEGKLKLERLNEEGQVIASEEQSFRVEAFESDAQRAGTIALQISNDLVTMGESIPVTVGVPFPRGVLRSTDHLRLMLEKDGQIEEIPVQVTETARWSRYGSLKWVLLDFSVDVPSAGEALFIEYGPEVVRIEGAGMGYQAGEQFPEIQAGRLLFGDGVWFDPVGNGEYVQVFQSGALAGGFVEHEDARIYRMSEAADYVVERSGPEALVLRREGWLEEERSGRAFCKYIARYYVFRDSPLLRIDYTWIFTGDGNHDRIRNMGWQFDLADGFENASFLPSFNQEVEWVTGSGLLQFDYDHFEIFTSEDTLDYPHGRAPGVAKIEGPGVDLYFGTRDFWQNYPSELEFRDGVFWFHNWPRHNKPAGYRLDGELIAASGEPALPTAERHARYQPDQLTRSEWLLNVIQHRHAHEGEVLDFRTPDEYAQDPIEVTRVTSRGREREWEQGRSETSNAQGVSRTEEMWLYLTSADTPSSQAGQIMAGLNNNTLRAVVDPVWVAASGAFYEMHPKDVARFPEYEHAYELAALSPLNLIEELGLYGMWIYGDIAAWGPRLATREPALYRAFRKRHHGWPYSWKPYARSGDSRMLTIASAATRQMVDGTYSYYYDDKVVRSSGSRGRGIGIWGRGLLPWGAHHPPHNRNYESKSDFLWHNWFLTGYPRAMDNLSSWIEQTKANDTSRITPTHNHGRTPITLMKSYLETWEATFDPWFLVAAHALATGALDYADENEEWQGGDHPWDTAYREFDRYTGSQRMRSHYQTVVDSYVDRFYGRAQGVWIRASTTMMPNAAYISDVAESDDYLRRLRGDLDLMTSLVRDGKEPAMYQGYIRRGEGTEYSLFTGWYLRYFPAALDALAKAETQPMPIPRDFSYRPTSGEDGTLQTVIAMRKDAAEPLSIDLRSRMFSNLSRAEEKALEVSYTVWGPDETVILDGNWDVREDKLLEVPAGAAAGVYRLRLTYSSAREVPALIIPLTPIDTPEVLLVQDGETFEVAEGGMWFFVPAETERFRLSFPHYTGASVWDPAGRRVWSQADYRGLEDAYEADIEVSEQQAGQLWWVALPSGGVVIDAALPAVVSTDPARWFDLEQAP